MCARACANGFAECKARRRLQQRRRPCRRRCRHFDPHRSNAQGPTNRACKCARQRGKAQQANRPMRVRRLMLRQHSAQRLFPCIACTAVFTRGRKTHANLACKFHLNLPVLWSPLFNNQLISTDYLDSTKFQLILLATHLHCLFHLADMDPNAYPPPPPPADMNLNSYPPPPPPQQQANMDPNNPYAQSMSYAQAPQQPQQQMAGQFSPGSYFIADPMIAAAGQQFIGQYSQNLVHNTGGWIDRNLRPLFAVDDSYVIKKLGFVMFPFIQKRWHANQESPKENLVQPDLYIPLMSFMTYVLAASYMLGLKDKFSPEQLGIISSSALGCLALEVTLMVVLFNVFNVKTWYSFLHYISFCGYKFVPIIAAMFISLFLTRTSYYIMIGYATLALGFYLMKSFHVAIESSSHDNFDHKASRTGIYLVAVFCLLQPLFMFWLSYYLIP